MSQEQPTYYSPAPAHGVAPVPGTPQYQYVTPQPLDASQQQQYAQYQQPQPETILQQPYYPAQTPAPVFQQPGEFKEQPAAVYATEAHPAQPVVISAAAGDRTGLMKKMHHFNTCCGFIPLHTGAMIIAILMVIFYGFCGLVLLTANTWVLTSYNAIFMILGVLYLGVAFVSIGGFIGAYKQDPIWVNKFVTFFVIGSLVWAIMEIIEMAISVAAYAKYCGAYSAYYSCGFGWARWIITFLLGLAFQYYFACCLVSYQRELTAKLNGGDVEGGHGGKPMEMH